MTWRVITELEHKVSLKDYPNTVRGWQLPKQFLIMWGSDSIQGTEWDTN